MLISRGEVPEKAEQDTIEHFCRVNGVGPKQFHVHFEEEVALWHQRNELEWQVDWGASEEEVNEVNRKRAKTAQTKTDKNECFDAGPEDRVPESCPKCHAVGSLALIDCDTDAYVPSDAFLEAQEIPDIKERRKALRRLHALKCGRVPGKIGRPSKFTGTRAERKLASQKAIRETKRKFKSARTE